MTEKEQNRLSPSREVLAWMKRESLKWPSTGLLDVPKSDWPTCPTMPVRVMRNRHFLVQIFPWKNGAIRLSIQRCEFDVRTGHWVDGITWDELQALKDWAGFADCAAVEIYPPTPQIVDVANLRHLWVIDEPPAFMWSRK